MAHPYHHSVSSARKFGGKPEDYNALHSWFDDTKATFADFRHRALKHHSLGIFWCEKEFGVTITNSDGKEVPVRLVAEQHVREDCGYVPSVQDWLVHLKPEKWMGRPPIKLERELELTEGEVTV
jgi:hypothetical protein